MIDAASGSVAKRILAVDPGAPHHLLLPGLVDAQVGGVDEAAEDQVGEVLAEVVEVHPAEGQAKRKRQTGESGYRLAEERKFFNRFKMKGNQSKEEH